MDHNVGNEIEISYRKTILFGNVIGAIKEQNGQISKISGGVLFLYFFVRTLLLLLPFLILFTISIFISSNIGTALPVLGSVILWFLYPAIQLHKDKKIKKALGN